MQTSISPCCWINRESCTGAGNNGDTCSKALCQMPVCQEAERCSLGSRLLPAVTLRNLTAPYLLNGGTIIQNVPYTQGAAYTCQITVIIFSPLHLPSVPKGLLVSKKIPASSDSLQFFIYSFAFATNI